MLNKADQARINGAKSRGPVTEEGKAKVSQNGTKHGGYSSRIIIKGESEEAYQALHRNYWDFYNPTNQSEADAVQDIITNLWKIRRFEAMETDYFKLADAYFQDHEDYQQAGPAAQHRACFDYLIRHQPSFEVCAKFLDRYQRAHARAIRTLDRIRKAAGKPKVTADPSEVENEIEKDPPSNTPQTETSKRQPPQNHEQSTTTQRQPTDHKSPPSS